MIILDTNVISELMVAAPSRKVMAWLDRQDPREMRSTAITLAEMRFGTELLPSGKRRRSLEALAADIFARYFPGKVLPFDEASALHFPSIALSARRKGFTVDLADLQIASIAANWKATIATRNTKDFAFAGVDLVNPWTAE